MIIHNNTSNKTATTGAHNRHNSYRNNSNIYFYDLSSMIDLKINT